MVGELVFASLVKAGQRDLTRNFAVALCLAVASSTVTAQSVEEDDYVKMITEEVQQVNIESGNSSGYLPIGLQSSAFEKLLQQDFPTVYVLYRSLSQSNQERAFNFYKNNNAIKKIQNYIARLLASS